MSFLKRDRSTFNSNSEEITFVALESHGKIAGGSLEESSSSLSYAYAGVSTMTKR